MKPRNTSLPSSLARSMPRSKRNPGFNKSFTKLPAWMSWSQNRPFRREPQPGESCLTTVKPVTILSQFCPESERLRERTFPEVGGMSDLVFA